MRRSASGAGGGDPPTRLRHGDSPIVARRATVEDMSDKAHGRFDLVVQAYRPGQPYRLVMLADGSYRQLHSRRELDELAARLGLDPADRDRVAWEGGDEWPESDAR